MCPLQSSNSNCSLRLYWCRNSCCHRCRSQGPSTLSQISREAHRMAYGNYILLQRPGFLLECSLDRPIITKPSRAHRSWESYNRAFNQHHENQFYSGHSSSECQNTNATRLFEWMFDHRRSKCFKYGSLCCVEDIIWAYKRGRPR